MERLVIHERFYTTDASNNVCRRARMGKKSHPQRCKTKQIREIRLPFKIGAIWFYIGLSVFIIGLALMAIATFNFIATPVDQFVRKGAYKLSRHPMYLATFLICLGSGIATVSLLFILLSIIMASCFYQEALIEERYCN
jgi:protein-S-isoprenylcysteine O-methyltransferase Ste14